MARVWPVTETGRGNHTGQGQVRARPAGTGELHDRAVVEHPVNAAELRSVALREMLEVTSCYAAQEKQPTQQGMIDHDAAAWTALGDTYVRLVQEHGNKVAAACLDSLVRIAVLALITAARGGAPRPGGASEVLKEITVHILDAEHGDDATGSAGA